MQPSTDSPVKPPLHVPIAFGHWLVAGDRMECRLPRKTATVRAPRKLLQQVVRLCDGTRGWAQVVQELQASWSSDAVASFMLALCKERLLVESGQLWAHWSELAQLPQPARVDAEGAEIALLPLQSEERLLPGTGICEESVLAGENPIAEALRLRESFRTFDDQPITLQVLCSILWAAHGVTRESHSPSLRWHRTAASGGNMHSARWIVVALRSLPSVRQDHSALLPGVYEVRFHTGGGTSLKKLAGDARRAWSCLRDPRVLRHASALVLPVYDIAVPARKYGNRATLFAALEAGLCLQNAQLMSASLGVACMVRGDTIASCAIELAGLAQEGHHWFSVPGLVVGAMPTPEQKRCQELEGRFKVAPGLRPKAAAGREQARFAFAVAPVQGFDAQGIAGSGRASDPRAAMDLAEAETWERMGWGGPRHTREASLQDVQRPLHPEQLVAYSARQHRAAGFPFSRFDPGRRYLWIEALDADSGAARPVPAECVHALHALPVAFRENACTSSSTSGVAAGTSPEDALMRATLELVERDAFCCAWLSRVACPGIQASSLPGELRSRMDGLAAQDVQVSLVDLSNRWCAVVAVFLQSTALPFTAITAAAGFDAEAVASKALSEAEGRLAFAQHLGVDDTAGDAMRSIERYYRNPRTYRRSDFFRPQLASRRLADVAQDSARSWAQMRSRLRADGFNLLCADITPAGAAIAQGRHALTVVRALVPGLIPIWFHRGLQPEGMRRYKEVGRAAGGRPAGSFMHPFT